MAIKNVVIRPGDSINVCIQYDNNSEANKKDWELQIRPLSMLIKIAQYDEIHLASPGQPSVAITNIHGKIKKYLS